MAVYGDLSEVEESEPASYEPSQVLDPQETLIPRKVSKFGVPIVHDGDISYIAGIQIVTEEDGQTIYLGYTRSEVTTCIEVNCVKGLTTSIGTRGIHALQVVMDDDSLSAWLGNPDRGAVTRRFVFAKQIIALAAAFGVSLHSVLFVYIANDYRASNLLTSSPGVHEKAPPHREDCMIPSGTK